MKILFIIANKYHRKLNTLLDLYITNIKNCYNDDADILIVDNNSENINDIELLIKKYNNCTLIINNSSSKYELGAYRYGIEYIGNNITNYEYIIFTQDNFILNKKYDFNNLIDNNIKACTIATYVNCLAYDCCCKICETSRKVLNPINMYNKLLREYYDYQIK